MACAKMQGSSIGYPALESCKELGWSEWGVQDKEWRDKDLRLRTSHIVGVHIPFNNTHQLEKPFG